MLAAAAPSPERPLDGTCGGMQGGYSNQTRTFFTAVSSRNTSCGQ
jgi:hypothetical protein